MLLLHPSRIISQIRSNKVLFYPSKGIFLFNLKISGIIPNRVRLKILESIRIGGQILFAMYVDVDGDGDGGVKQFHNMQGLLAGLG
jgi:hypothetical protein